MSHVRHSWMGPTAENDDGRGRLVRLLVLLEPSDDVRIPPQRDRRSGGMRTERQVRRPDPAGARALDIALALRAARPGTEVVSMLLGSENDDTFLRETLARGCDEAIRIWDEECLRLHAPGKAVILAAAARAARCGLVLTGAASETTASAQVGVLVAAHLGVPCVTQAVDLEVPAGGLEGSPVRATGVGPAVAPGPVRATRGLAGGFREIVEVSPPAVITFVPAEPDVSVAPLIAILDAHSRQIPVWDLAELGVPREDVRRADGSLRYGRLRTPRPTVRGVPAPDSAAPAFERIGELVRGTVRRRDGRVSSRPVEELADELFQALRDGGWLDHLRQGEME